MWSYSKSVVIEQRCCSSHLGSSFPDRTCMQLLEGWVECHSTYSLVLVCCWGTVCGHEKHRCRCSNIKHSEVCVCVCVSECVCGALVRERKRMFLTETCNANEIYWLDFTAHIHLLAKVSRCVWRCLNFLILQAAVCFCRLSRQVLGLQARYLRDCKHTDSRWKHGTKWRERESQERQ